MTGRVSGIMVAACCATAIALVIASGGQAGSGKGGEDAATLARSQYRTVDGDILLPEGVGFAGTPVVSGGLPSLDAQLAPDILVTPDGAYTEELWPGGEVPYFFDANVAANDANCNGGSCQQLMLNAMATWEASVNVDFRPRQASELNYIYIQDSTGNASHVGMIGGPQIVAILRWNEPYIIAHELGHALGFWHEHSRTDRDTYIEVNCENTSSGCCPDGPCDLNFRVQSDALNYGPYDFDSVMHYNQCTFDTCPGRVCPFPVPPGCVTINVLPPNDFIPGTGTCDAGAMLCDSGTLIGQPCLVDQDCQLWQNAIGQRDHLSDFDRLVMSFLYPEDDWVFVDAAAKGQQTGTFFKPYKTFASGVAATPPGGTLWIQPGGYAAAGTYAAPITIRAPIGGVSLE